MVNCGGKRGSRLGMLRKARKVIPRDACITLYNAMILPLFDYCSAVWDGCGKTNRDYLDKLQTRAASIIEGRKVEQCEIHDILDWPTLDSRRKYQICLLPTSSMNSISHPISKNIKLETKTLLTRAKTTKYQSSFRYNGAKAWNTLPHLVRTETSLSSFKHKLKKHLFM